MSLPPSRISADNEAYQSRILVHVSRTFALTIPQLPVGLRGAVTTAYLLCRAADTIEDEPSLPPTEKREYLDRFIGVVAGTEPAMPFARELSARLSDGTSVHERDLIEHLAWVVEGCQALEARQRHAIERCIEIMCAGMHQFQREASLRGLRRVEDLDRYCYHVAGVVGEMLTELFCAYSPDIDVHAAALRRLAPSFGQGLQMTNILKDVWDDRSRGACWLPQEVFDRRGLDLSRLVAGESHSFGDSMEELIGIAHGHLRHALSFTLLIPASQSGIRRFCAWSIGMALLTLRSIKNNPQFTAGAQVKISRYAVMSTIASCNVAIRSDWLLTQLFALASRSLPSSAQPTARSWAEPQVAVLDEWQAERGLQRRTVRM